MLQRDGVLVFHIAWRMTASLHATATRAFLKPGGDIASAPEVSWNEPAMAYSSASN